MYKDIRKEKNSRGKGNVEFALQKESKNNIVSTYYVSLFEARSPCTVCTI